MNGGFLFAEVGSVTAVRIAVREDEGEDVEFFDHVGGILDEFCSLLDEMIAAVGGGPVDVARDGEHGAALIHGLIGGDERTAAHGCFHHDGAASPAADNAIALGEGGFVRGVIDRVFADHCAVGGDAFGEACVFRRIKFRVT